MTSIGKPLAALPTCRALCQLPASPNPELLTLRRRETLESAVCSETTSASPGGSPGAPWASKGEAAPWLWQVRAACEVLERPQAAEVLMRSQTYLTPPSPD